MTVTGSHEFPGQIDREHDLRELALRIGAAAAVALRDHHVVEIDRVLAERSDVDDPRRRACPQQGQQQVGEQKAGEIVDGEAQLVTVLAGLPRRAFILRSDPGIADENIQPPVVGKHGFGKFSHIGK